MRHAAKPLKPVRIDRAKIAPALTAGMTVLALGHSASGQIRTDGSLGPAAAMLAGPNFTIGAELGKQVGGNLFHSFQTFNLRSDPASRTVESATFTGPNSVDNIIGRVTGGERSLIDGKIASTIPNANLFLINPSGWVFGPNASLDIGGSFHVSSADYLRLADGTRFQATANGSTYTAAPPEAFGFLGSNPSSIVVADINGRGSELTTRPGKRFSIVGGAIGLGNARVAAPGGQVQVRAAAGPGEISVDPADNSKSTVQSFAPIALVAGAVVEASDQRTLEGGGSVYIRGGAISVVDGSTIRSMNFGSAPGQPLSVQADTLTLLRAGLIGTSSFAGGAAGPVNVAANEILVDGGGFGSGIVSTADAKATGNAGDVSVQTSGKLTLAGLGYVSSNTNGIGKAGRVSVTAGEISASGAVEGSSSGIFSEVSKDASGEAKGVFVKAGKLTLTAGANISSLTNGSGQAGPVDVAVPGGEIVIDSGGVPFVTGIGSEARKGSTGGVGNVSVSAGKVTLSVGGAISSSTFGSRNAGNVVVQAPDIVIDGNGVSGGAVIRSEALQPGSGNAGEVNVSGDRIKLVAGGAISSTTRTGGNAGKITIEAKNLEIDGTNVLTGIASEANNSGYFGNGGDIFVTADELALTAGGVIDSSTFSAGRAGSVTVSAGGISAQRGGISSTAQPGSSGKAGEVTVDANRLTLLADSVIDSSTYGSGSAGMVAVTGTGSDPVLTIDGNGAVGRMGILSTAATAAANGLVTNGGEIKVSNWSKLAINGARGGNNAASTGIISDTGSIIDLDRNSTANAGNISVNVGELTISGEAGIRSSTFNHGNAGTVGVEAARIDLDGSGNSGTFLAGINAQSILAAGNAGNVSVNAHSKLSLGPNSGIDSSSIVSAGNAGIVTVTAPEITIEGKGSPNSAIASAAGVGSTGKAGQVTVNASKITIDGAGVMSKPITLEVGPSLSSLIGIASASVGPEQGGGVEINTDSLIVRNGGTVTAQTAGATGGDVGVNARDLVYLDRGQITTSVAGGQGSGGNIFIDPNLVVLNRGTIVADAVRGNGGNIQIRAGQYLKSSDSVVRAASEFGLSGTVALQAPETSLTGSLADLSGKLQAPTQVRQEACASVARREREPSSLVVRGRGGLPQDGETAQPGTYFAGRDDKATAGANPERAARHPVRSASATAPRITCGKPSGSG